MQIQQSMFCTGMVILVAIFPATQTWSTYSPEFTSDLELVPVQSSETHLIEPGSKAFMQISSLFEGYTHQIFTLEQPMSHCYKFFMPDEYYSLNTCEELRLQYPTVRQCTGSNTKKVMNKYSTMFLVITSTTEKGNSTADKEFSLVSLGSGKATQLDSFSQKMFISEIYITDLDCDGSLELIYSWTSGTGTAGGVFIRTIQPSGKFSEIRHAENDGYGIDVDYGGFALLDFDNDGIMELEGRTYFDAGPHRIIVKQLYALNSSTGKWIPAPNNYSDYYAPDREHIQNLMDCMQVFLEDPLNYKLNDDLGTPYCQVDGVRYDLAEANDYHLTQLEWGIEHLLK